MTRDELSLEQIDEIINVLANMQSEFVSEDPRYIALDFAMTLAYKKRLFVEVLNYIDEYKEDATEEEDV